MPNLNSAPGGNESNEAPRDVSKMSDTELEQMAAVARAARAAAAAAEAPDTAAIEAAAKAAKESFDWTGPEQDRRGFN